MNKHIFFTFIIFSGLVTSNSLGSEKMRLAWIEYEDKYIRYLNSHVDENSNPNSTKQESKVETADMHVDQLKASQALQDIFKQDVEQLLATAEDLSHLTYDSPLLNPKIFMFPDLAEKLIAKKANLEAVDKMGCTPLYLAVLHNNSDCVALFLKAGANPNHLRDNVKEKQTEKRVTALDLRHFGYQPLSAPHATNKDTVLKLAIETGQRSTANLLLAHGAIPVGASYPKFMGPFPY